MSASEDITTQFDKILDFLQANCDQEIQPFDPVTGTFIENTRVYVTRMLDDYVHGHAELIREYIREGKPPAGIRTGPGVVWYMGGLEKAANIIDPYLNPEARG